MVIKSGCEANWFWEVPTEQNQWKKNCCDLGWDALRKRKNENLNRILISISRSVIVWGPLYRRIFVIHC